MALRIPVVPNVEDEDLLMGKCECGGSWALAAEEVVPVRLRWYDSLVMTCRSCRQHRRYLFDITPFFDPRPGVWAA